MKSNEDYISSKSDYYVYNPSATAKKLFFYPTHLGHFYYEPNYHQQRENFNSFLLMLVVKGSCVVHAAGQSVTAKEGSIVFLDCYAPHEYGSSIGWEALWIHFDGPLARDYYEHIQKEYGNVISPESFQNMRYLFDKIYHLFRMGKQANEPVLSQYITGILTEILKTEPATQPYSVSNFMDQVITYINENFKKPIRLNDLAEIAALSPFYFTRVFAKETGVPPHQYIISTRMSYAKYMLKSTSISIKEIAFDSGFTSEGAFCSAFKKAEKLTPSEYRHSGQ